MPEETELSSDAPNADPLTEILGGCGSTITCVGISFITTVLLGGAFLVKKKED